MKCTIWTEAQGHLHFYRSCLDMDPLFRICLQRRSAWLGQRSLEIRGGGPDTFCQSKCNSFQFHLASMVVIMEYLQNS